MAPDHAQVQDEIAPCALEALDELARAEVEAHLAGCAECSAQLWEYRAVVGLLPLALPGDAPSLQARTRLLERVHASAAGARPGGEARALPPVRRRWRLPAVGAAVAAVLVAGLAFWGLQLERRLARLAPEVDLGELARMPAGLLLELVGSGMPGASARLLVAADGGRAALVVTGLAPLPAHRVYQLWFAQAGERPVTGGAFRVNARGETAVAVSVPIPITKARAIAVTEEPAPMSPAPTGAHLLDLRAR